MIDVYIDGAVSHADMETWIDVLDGGGGGGDGVFKGIFTNSST